jgi:hypothetical protein
VEEADPYNFHKGIEQLGANQENKGEDNTNTRDIREGANEGSYEVEDFEVGDHVVLRYPIEFYSFFGRKTRKGWDGPFTVKKIRQNKEIVIWDEVM